VKETLSTAPSSQIFMRPLEPPNAPVAAPLLSSTPDIEVADSYPIPSNNRLIAIELPAILSSIDAGITSLGGDSAIAKAFSCPLGWQNSSNRDVPKPTLELRYRPGDRYQHPIISQPVKLQNIVIKLGKNKENDRIENVEIVGVVDTAFRFRGHCFAYNIGKCLQVDIADIQYHPYPDSKFVTQYEEAFTGLKCTSHKFIRVIEDDKLSKFEISMEEDDLSNIDFMPPPLFSRIVVPQIYKYIPHTLFTF
jgi:hypothetical protein